MKKFNSRWTIACALLASVGAAWPVFGQELWEGGNGTETDFGNQLVPQEQPALSGPVLYTHSLQVAQATSRKLAEEVRAQGEFALASIRADQLADLRRRYGPGPGRTGMTSRTSRTCS